MLPGQKIGWLAAALLGFLTALCPHIAWAEGALAVGISGNIAKDGYSIGIAVDRPSNAKAREGALDWCRHHGSAKTSANCKIISTFHHHCAAEANDPKPGTPGAGWAVALDKTTAGEMAMANCLATAGRDRQQFCKVLHTLCDSEP